MRALVALAIAATAVASSVFAQQAPTPPKDGEETPSRQSKNSCLPIKALIDKEETATGRLFLLDAGKWQEADPKWWKTYDVTLNDYNGGKLYFIYVAPRTSGPAERQFLSIRTTAEKNDSSTNSINVRRRDGQRGMNYVDTQVYSGQYQNYHLNFKPSGKLAAFHEWYDGARSDEPSETRRAWSFKQDGDRLDNSMRRRVLGISYVPNQTAVTCAPFVLGPNLASRIIQDSDDSDVPGDITPMLGAFAIEISEVKDGTGKPGRVFTIHSEPQKR